MKFTQIMKLVFVIYIFFMFGCAGTVGHLRAMPSAHFPTHQDLKLPPDIPADIKLHCIREEEIQYRDLDTTNSECIFVSVDASSLSGASLTRDQRTNIFSTLLGISEMNCNNWLQRVFANKAGLDFGKGLMSDIMTGVSAGIVTLSAPASAVLNGVNLVSSKGVDNFNKTYFYDKTFQAMEAAIRAERAKRKALLISRSADYSKYSIVEELADLGYFDDACSIKEGLNALSNLAEESKKTNEKNKLEVESATNKVETFKRKEWR